ncbi:DUF5004 domain-containing protein [Flagellimonas halotolerans]|uniref:DUF5004 domain-containing protein n=1 Tax=Flagellimonas halotolerans TaxID=3112164 RepID=A0ABU6IPX4_9FLAO|nr:MULTISPECIES: DUF5004 domain-containing protein [unclassified Allomuricauda]MEC3965302.1 DUF5004 domain-containing protein [Muricauda sp. SYSU M86414]MEC4265168.1 DUF5004 domain-containing protein [Muricauda sp. SYSU M84420]
MKEKLFNAGILMCIGAMLLSCTSDDGVECAEDFTGDLSANEQKLVGEWVLSGIVAAKELDLTDDNTDNPSTDLFAQYAECKKDASYTFGEDRSYAYELGKYEEDCEYIAASTGTWELASQNLSLVSSCSLQTTVLEFNEDSSQFTFSEIYSVTEVTGTVVQTRIDFTYSLMP